MIQRLCFRFVLENGGVERRCGVRSQPTTGRRGRKVPRRQQSSRAPVQLRRPKGAFDHGCSPSRTCALQRPESYRRLVHRLGNALDRWSFRSECRPRGQAAAVTGLEEALPRVASWAPNDGRSNDEQGAKGAGPPRRRPARLGPNSPENAARCGRAPRGPMVPDGPECGSRRPVSGLERPFWHDPTVPNAVPDGPQGRVQSSTQTAPRRRRRVDGAASTGPRRRRRVDGARVDGSECSGQPIVWTAHLNRRRWQLRTAL
ncbi:hypothetical protein M885DRAFT_290972 [Pelagophyceae sp. CCMP2097]|nr:hypothetical protein M885DRAFT_290972 [Pelagophyceae sp. CCMP2097]